MKLFSKTALIGTLALPLMTSLFSCSEDPDCSMNARPMMTCNLYTQNEGKTEPIELTTLTITAFGTDSTIVNKEANVKKLSLPLRYAADSTVLVFHYEMDPKDTLVIRHDNTPYFLSMDCGYQMKQVITGVTHTHHQLDSIAIQTKEAGIYEIENLQLFY